MSDKALLENLVRAEQYYRAAFVGLAGGTVSVQNYRLWADAIAAAINKLSENGNQEAKARVYTVKELVALKRNDVVWLEDWNESDVIPGIIDYCHDWVSKTNRYNACFSIRNGVQVRTLFEDYGKRWRCWTELPTDEQRDSVSWENLEVTHEN